MGSPSIPQGAANAASLSSVASDFLWCLPSDLLPFVTPLFIVVTADRIINGADHWVIYEEIPFSIPPGGGAHRDEDNERWFTFPQTIPPGTYYMGMWVDDIREVRECDENDNVSIGKNVFRAVSRSSTTETARGGSDSLTGYPSRTCPSGLGPWQTALWACGNEAIPDQCLRSGTTPPTW